jgi:L-ascorbate metabolism protein UlaG (beta-lactamase superfamily)
MTVTNTLTLPDASTAVPTDEGSIFFIGNATVLLRVAGFTILTDPTFIHKHEQTWLGEVFTPPPHRSRDRAG